MVDSTLQAAIAFSSARRGKVLRTSGVVQRKGGARDQSMAFFPRWLAPARSGPLVLPPPAAEVAPARSKVTALVVIRVVHARSGPLAEPPAPRHVLPNGAVAPNASIRHSFFRPPRPPS